MAIKRKRSDFEDSPASTTSSASHAIRNASSSPSPAPEMGRLQAQTLWGWTDTPSNLSSQMNSRTRKRWRDDRPDEQAMHQRTLGLLFAAQNSPTLSSPSPVPSAELPAATDNASQKRKPQSSLHAFWSIPSAPPPQATIEADMTDGIDRPRCEDCDAEVNTEGGWQEATKDGQNHPRGAGFCDHCGGLFCDLCSISSWGRHCLKCAT